MTPGLTGAALPGFVIKVWQRPWTIRPDTRPPAPFSLRHQAVRQRGGQKGACWVKIWAFNPQKKFSQSKKGLENKNAVKQNCKNLIKAPIWKQLVRVWPGQSASLWGKRGGTCSQDWVETKNRKLLLKGSTGSEEIRLAGFECVLTNQLSGFFLRCPPLKNYTTIF